VEEWFTDVVEDHDGDELAERVGGHVLEDAERGDEGAAALADQLGHARDAAVARRERRRHRRLRVGQRDARVRRLQRAAVVGAVAAHPFQSPVVE